MTEELKHSPLPWVVGQHPAMTRGWIINPVLFGNKIIRLPECEGGHVALKSKADAELIVKAVNSHAALVEALEEALNGLRNTKVALECALIREGNQINAVKIATKRMNAEIHARELAEDALAESEAKIAALVEALEVAGVALECSEPKMAHYNEPMARHITARSAVKSAITQAEKALKDAK